MTGGNNESGIFPKETTKEAIAVPIVFGFIFFLGLVGNITVLYIIARKRYMRTVPNMFIVNLAIGDLLLIIICVPFTSTIYTFKDWPYGEVVCKVNEFMQTVSVGVSVFSLMALSAERYKIITKPAKYDFDKAKNATVGTISLIWLLSVTLAIPDGLSAHIKVYETPWGDNLEFCNIFPLTWGPWYPKVHTLVRFLVLFTLPVCFITGFYCRLACHLVSKGRAVLKQPDLSAVSGTNQKLDARVDVLNGSMATALLTQTNKNMYRRRHVLALVVLALVLIFVVCWLPRYVYLFWFHFDPGIYTHTWHTFKIVAFCLMFLNSAINPYLLCLLDNSIRKGMYRHLFCFACCKKSCLENESEGSLEGEDTKAIEITIETGIQEEEDKV